MKKLSFISQFKIEFLLLFTGFRKVLGKMPEPILINFHPNKYTQGLYYYLFAINLDRYVRSSNTLKYLSN